MYVRYCLKRCTFGDAPTCGGVLREWDVRPCARVRNMVVLWCTPLRAYSSVLYCLRAHAYTLHASITAWQAIANMAGLRICYSVQARLSQAVSVSVSVSQCVSAVCVCVCVV